MDNSKIVISKLTHKTLKENINFLKKFSIPYSSKIEISIRESILSLKQFPHANIIYYHIILIIFLHL